MWRNVANLNIHFILLLFTRNFKELITENHVQYTLIAKRMRNFSIVREALMFLHDFESLTISVQSESN